MEQEDIIVELKDIHKSLGGKKVLEGLNLKIKRGETLVIIGRSGIGKSVLLKHIAGLMKPDKGEVIIDGVDITQLNEKELTEVQKKIGMVFQGAALFDSLTVEENVGFFLFRYKLKELGYDKIRKIVREKLRLVGLSGVENMLPSELSGGMKKRVGLARAIANDPEIILYDEPTTGLDPILADAINNLIVKTQKALNVTSVVVTHDMVSAYKVADRIAMINNGKIIFEGRPDEVKNSDNPYLQQFIEGRSEGPIKVI